MLGPRSILPNLMAWGSNGYISPTLWILIYLKKAVRQAKKGTEKVMLKAKAIEKEFEEEVGSDEEGV